MSKFSVDESKTLIEAAAAAIKRAKLADKANSAAHPVETYKDGDIITILGGLAKVSEFVNSEKAKVKFLCFDATVSSADGSTRPVTISLSSLITPSWGDSEAIISDGKRDFKELKLRFGSVKINFTETNGVSVPYLDEDTELPALTVRKVFVPKYGMDGYTASSKEWAVVE